MIDVATWDVAQLRAAFDASVPFRHLIIDDFLGASELADARAAFDDESAERLQDEIMDVLAGPAPPESPGLCAVAGALASAPFLSALSLVTSSELRGVELRSYVYQPGSYLLPHADRDAAGRRQIAFALYLGRVGALEGGELDFYELREAGDGRITTAVARTISPRTNRVVFFEVHARALHQVREVTLGARLSLAGWFLR